MRIRTTKTGARQAISMAMLATVLCATGCKNFFTPINGTTTTTTTVTNTGDFAYVASAYTASTTPIYSLSAFSIGAGTLTALTGSPIALPFAPSTVVVNPANSLLYVAGSGVIYGYTISSTGTLTAIESATSTPALENANIVSMVISPDGQWLLALDINNTEAVIDEFQIASTGELTALTSTQYALTGSPTIVPSSIAISPAGNYVAVALGTGGDVVYSFVTSTGALTQVAQENPPTASSADQALVFDSTGATLYVARSGTDGGVVPYVISDGGATLTAAAGAPFATGSGPASILLDKTGTYLYVGNRSDSTVSAFSVATGGVLTTISGSPFATGTTPNALAADNSGKYILATASGGSPDVKMFAFTTIVNGGLVASTTALTGDPTEPAGAVAIALTH